MNEPCLCGDPACKRCFPGGSVEVTDAHLEQALESVVETIMLFGEYPQPRMHVRGILGTPPRRRLFDLHDWVIENVDAVNWYVRMVTEYGSEFDAQRLDETNRIEKLLREELRDSQIVYDKAADIAHEEAEEA